jgi:protein SCO1
MLAWPRSILFYVVCCVFLLTLPACFSESKTFKNTDITGSALTLDFQLKNSQGQAVNVASFKGKVLVVFFGFIHCPDVCPTTLQIMAKSLGYLSATEQEKVAVVFITLDPVRDTPVLLAQYPTQFNPNFIGLTGTEQQIEHAAKGLRVFYQKVPGASAENYAYDHTASSYIADSNGRLRLLVRHNTSPEDIAADLKQLL